MRDLPRWQHQYLGLETVPRNIGELELSAFFTFSPTELKKLNTLRRPELRVSAGVQLGFLKMTGRTLEGVDVVPAVLLKHIGKQLNAPAPSIASLKAIYRKRIRTLRKTKICWRWRNATHSATSIALGYALRILIMSRCAS